MNVNVHISISGSVQMTDIHVKWLCGQTSLLLLFINLQWIKKIIKLYLFVIQYDREGGVQG